MSFHVVDSDERKVVRGGKFFGIADALFKRGGETRSTGDGNGIQLGATSYP